MHTCTHAHNQAGRNKGKTEFHFLQWSTELCVVVLQNNHFWPLVTLSVIYYIQRTLRSANRRTFCPASENWSLHQPKHPPHLKGFRIHQLQTKMLFNTAKACKILKTLFYLFSKTRGGSPHSSVYCQCHLYPALPLAAQLFRHTANLLLGAFQTSGNKLGIQVWVQHSFSLASNNTLCQATASDNRLQFPF